MRRDWWFVGVAAVLLLSFMALPHAWAYNCQEACRRQARYRSPWGSWEINPVKHATCQTWKHANCHSIGCSAFGEAARALYTEAAHTMGRRSEGKYKRGLTFDEKSILHPLYGDLVDRVTVHFSTPPLDKGHIGNYTFSWSGVYTGAQTFGYHIYFRDSRSIVLNNFEDYALTLGHELMHSRQYEQRGKNISRFGQDYIKAWCEAGREYAANPMEKEAVALEYKINRKIKTYLPIKNTVPRYAVTCIRNPTRRRLQYRITWQGTGPEYVTIEPNTTLRHSYPLKYARQQPGLEIRFDRLLNARTS